MAARGGGDGLAVRRPARRYGSLRDLGAPALRRRHTRVAPGEHGALFGDRPGLRLAPAGSYHGAVRRRGRGPRADAVRRPLASGSPAKLPRHTAGFLLRGRPCGRAQRRPRGRGRCCGYRSSGHSEALCRREPRQRDPELDLRGRALPGGGPGTLLLAPPSGVCLASASSHTKVPFLDRSGRPLDPCAPQRKTSSALEVKGIGKERAFCRNNKG